LNALELTTAGQECVLGDVDGFFTSLSVDATSQAKTAVTINGSLATAVRRVARRIVSDGNTKSKQNLIERINKRIKANEAKLSKTLEFVKFTF
jgi:hypothetical protein